MCLNKNCLKMHQDFFVRSPTIIIFVEKRIKIYKKSRGYVPAVRSIAIIAILA